MILIFGGAYNGKLNYVKDKYNLRDEDIYYCNSSEINFDKKVISGFDIFTREMTLKNLDALDYINKNIDKFKDKIIISDDISSGIVPIDRIDRKWRDINGKILQILSKESNKVIRIFFGIEMILKNE